MLHGVGLVADEQDCAGVVRPNRPKAQETATIKGMAKIPPHVKKARDIFLWAEEYRVAVNLLTVNLQRDKRLMNGLFTLYALVLELHLKSLLTIETRKTPRVHSIRDLYGALSFGSRTRIRNDFDQALRTDVDMVNASKFHGIKDLDAAIDWGDEFFTRVRYLFEAGKPTAFLLAPVAHTAYDLILEQYPAWRNDDSLSRGINLL